MPGEGRKVWNFRGAEANKVREVKSPKRHSFPCLVQKQGWKERKEGSEDRWVEEVRGKSQQPLPQNFKRNQGTAMLAT